MVRSQSLLAPVLQYYRNGIPTVFTDLQAHAHFSSRTCHAHSRRSNHVCPLQSNILYVDIIYQLHRQTRDFKLQLSDNAVIAITDFPNYFQSPQNKSQNLQSLSAVVRSCGDVDNISEHLPSRSCSLLHYTPDPMIGPTLLGGSQDLRELLTEKSYLCSLFWFEAGSKEQG